MLKKIQRNLRKLGVSVFEKITGTFFTFHARPILATSMDTYPDSPDSITKTAITIQGPILHENNFTLESIRFYKKIFPKAIIILSTWIGEDEYILKLIESLGATIVRSKKPDFAGPFNENMQIVSSLAGLVKAKELGAMYALKSRTDQRMYAPNAIEFMINLTKAFPYTAPYPKQKMRIVACSLATLKYRPYGVTDMTLFGQIDDIIAYWSCPLDMRPTNTGKNTPTVRKFMDARICEMYFATEFLKRIGRNPLFTMRDSFRVYADHFIIADQDSLDIYWRKYEHHIDNRFTFYNGVRNDQDLTFREWLNLYSNPNYSVSEDILDLPFHGTIAMK